MRELRPVNNKLAPHNVVFDAVRVPNGDKELAATLSHKRLMLNPGQTCTTVIPADAPEGDYGFYCEPHRGAGEVGKLTVTTQTEDS